MGLTKRRHQGLQEAIVKRSHHNHGVRDAQWERQSTKWRLTQHRPPVFPLPMNRIREEDLTVPLPPHQRALLATFDEQVTRDAVQHARKFRTQKVQIISLLLVADVRLDKTDRVRIRRVVHNEEQLQLLAGLHRGRVDMVEASTRVGYFVLPLATAGQENADAPRYAGGQPCRAIRSLL